MNLVLTRGESRAWNIPITLSGVADPLDPADAIAFVAAYPNGTEAIRKTRADGILTIDAAQGEVQLQLEPEDTADLRGDTALVWQVWLVQGTIVTCIASGDMIVRAALEL